jgi:phage terminase large subunit
MKLTSVFDKNITAFLEGFSLIINQGGQGSSKTFSILQLLYITLKNSKNPLIASVCSYALPHLKIGVIRDLYKIITADGQDPDKIHNRSDHFFKIGVSTLEYFGIRDNYSKVHGPRRDLLYINECNNKVTYEDFDNLNQRTHLCTFIDYNPRSEFWLHESVIPHFKHKLIKSTFRNNPWIPEAELNKILWKKDKEQFKNWWRVYGEGETGTLEGQIFTNWDYFNPDLYGGVTFEEHIKQFGRGYGLDFGYHPDPDAMVKEAIDDKRKKIFLDEKMYQAGQSTDGLKAACLARVDKITDLIVAESANPRTIEDLKKNGGTVKTMGLNVVPVSKTGTLEEWLKELQEYELVITEDSHNLAKELNNYVWNDEKAGIPIDEFNHLIDAFRYYFMYQKQKINTNVWA